MANTLPAAEWTAAVPSRTAAVLDAIKHAILSGRFVPGQSLVEAELAQRLGVSKTPVREALKTLVGSGLVTMSPYKGATVRVVDDEFARALYDLRALLEPEAASRAVRRAGAGELADARAALLRSEETADQAVRSLANREFHRALYTGCGNPILVKTLDDLRDQTALVSAVGWTHAPSWEQEAREHRAILAAAEAGDFAVAGRLVAAHITGFSDHHFPRPRPTHTPW